MEALLVLVFAFVFLMYLRATRNFDYWRVRGVPFAKPIPFLGNTDLALFRKCIGSYLQHLYQNSHGSVYGFFLLDKPKLLIRDPKIIKQILVKDFQHFSNRTIVVNKEVDLIGSQMLFLLRNPEWKIIRQKMTVAFSSGKIKLMFPLMTEVGRDFVNYVTKSCGAPIETRELTLKYSTEVITSCAFGIKGFCFENENSEFFNVATKVFSFTWRRGVQMSCYFISPFLVKLFKMKFLDPYCATFFKNVFWEVFNLKKQTKVKRNDLIESLLDMGETDEDLTLAMDGDLAVAQAIQFYVGGYETSGSTACYALYQLAFNIDIQSRLREEILEVRKRHNGLTYDAVNEMKYLDMVLCEILRMYPVLPFLDRTAEVDYTIPGTDITIDKGTAIYVGILGIHFNPQYYPEPHKFDPERFTHSKRAERDNFWYLPFGEGPRGCIGARFGILASKLSIICMVSEFEITTTEKTPRVIDFNPRGFLLSPTKPIPLQYRKINTTQTL